MCQTLVTGVRKSREEIGRGGLNVIQRHEVLGEWKGSGWPRRAEVGCHEGGPGGA